MSQTRSHFSRKTNQLYPRLSRLAALFVLALFVAGCVLPAAQTAMPLPTPIPTRKATSAPLPTAEPSPTPKVSANAAGTLTVALSTEPNSLDLARTAERNAENAAWQIYDSLVWIDDAGAKAPALAQAWDISADSTEYTFYLRRNVTFHNGEPFNADAVIFSWERGRLPDMPWADRWNRAVAVEKLDDYAVKIRTAEPDPLFLAIVAQHWGIVPPGYMGEVGEEGFAAHPVGTGPFMFVEWVQGDHITLQANPDYWDPNYPGVETLTFKFISDGQLRAEAVRLGKVDIAQRLDSAAALALENAAGVTVLDYPVDRVYYIAFNNLTTGVGTPIEDARVRQALNLAVNRQNIVDALFGGYARLSTGLVTPADLGYDESLQPFAYDPGQAVTLLAEAGYPNGFSIELACPTEAYANFEAVCNAIQVDLGTVGVQVTIQFMESGAFWDAESQKMLPPLFGDSWSERSGEALPRLLGALGGHNASYSSWSDPEIDRILNELSVSVDDTTRAALYVDLQVYMQQNPPFIYLYEPVTFEAYNNAVHGYSPRGAEDYFLKTVTVTR